MRRSTSVGLREAEWSQGSLRWGRAGRPSFVDAPQPSRATPLACPSPRPCPLPVAPCPGAARPARCGLRGVACRRARGRAARGGAPSTRQRARGQGRGGAGVSLTRAGVHTAARPGARGSGGRGRGRGKKAAAGPGGGGRGGSRQREPGWDEGHLLAPRTPFKLPTLHPARVSATFRFRSRYPIRAAQRPVCTALHRGRGPSV